MTYLSVAVDVPRLDSVVVVESVRSGTQSADGNEFLAGRLRVAGIIGAPRLQRRLLAAPLPRKRKSRHRFRKNRVIQFCVAPALSFIGRNFDARNLPAPRPCHPVDLIKSRPVDALTAPTPRDPRFPSPHQGHATHLPS